MSFDKYLADFEDHSQIRNCVLEVLTALPLEVREDFLSDPTFSITLEDFTADGGWKLFMPCPTPTQTCVRQVVLRTKLEQANCDFARYVIAHELAHALLRNQGTDEHPDPEDAADALAANWGFSRPERVR